MNNKTAIDLNNLLETSITDKEITLTINGRVLNHSDITSLLAVVKEAIKNGYAELWDEPYALTVLNEYNVKIEYA